MSRFDYLPGAPSIDMARVQEERDRKLHEVIEAFSARVKRSGFGNLEKSSNTGIKEIDECGYTLAYKSATILVLIDLSIDIVSIEAMVRSLGSEEVGEVQQAVSALMGSQPKPRVYGGDLFWYIRID